MGVGLFDALSATVPLSASASFENKSEARLQSVVANLTHLLNTRRGTLPHLPDYGLPDLGTIYRNMPDSLEELRTSIQTTVEAYEPRLRRVRARPQLSESDSMRLMLVLTAELDGERVRFTTAFSSIDRVTVERFTRRD